MKPLQHFKAFAGIEPRWISLAGIVALALCACAASAAADRPSNDYVLSSPTLSIDDVTRSEGNAGELRRFTFTVKLSQPSTELVIVDFATADGTATVADHDYGIVSGTLLIPPGWTETWMLVWVVGDNTFEADETFFVSLKNARNAVIKDSQGVGTIKNDDSPPVAVGDDELVTEFALTRVAPNPTTGPARIEYAVAREAKVRVSVLDVQGRVVAVLVDGMQRAGRHQVVWSGGTERGIAPAGLYFIRYEAPGKNLVKRVILAR